MDGIFDVIDDSLKLSIVDSTMMSIVHRAMNKAHGRVKSREGVIERLHEISKFYELSVMQLDGCIKFVQEETDSHNPDRSYEEVLAGLAEIRNRLQRRLYESELAILQKDRELADRFESESKLREALEITERELISSQEDLEIARSANLSPRESEEGEFCELKDSVDRLEFDDYEPELMIRNHCTNDIKVEKMGSDIDILKETLDMAFGKMQSAIFCSEMGPIEQQIKSSIENDVISISLKGFVRDSQEDLQAEATKKERQISDLVNQVTGLCEDLKPLITQNGEECNILDFGSRTPKRQEKNCQVDFDDTFSESPVSLKSSMLQQVLEKLEILMVLNSKVKKSLGQNGDVNKEDISLEKNEQVFSDNNRKKSDVWIQKLHDEENMGMHNQITSDEMPWDGHECPKVCSGANLRFPVISYKTEAQTKDEITTVMLNEWEKSMEEHTAESLLREEISWFIFGETVKSITYNANHCLQTKIFDDFLRDLQITIQEDVCSVFFKEMVREWEEKIEACNMETSFREEICYTILNEAEREVCNRYKKVDVPREILGECTNTGLESLVQKLNLVSEGIEELENLVLSASFEIMDNNSNLKTLALECGFDESKATSVESKDIQSIFNSLSDKLEKTMKQLNDRLIVGEWKSSLETIVSEPEKVCQISPVGENLPYRKLSLSKLHNMQLNKLDSKCLKFLECPQFFYDFELMANKLGAIMLRLEEMKHCLDPLPRAMVSLRENESLYKKAFVRRCQNLRKAEHEVDLLGDQVDILLSLIEKIHLILNHHSPVLQQYLDVSEILRLIKNGVAEIVCTPPEKLDTSPNV